MGWQAHARETRWFRVNILHPAWANPGNQQQLEAVHSRYSRQGGSVSVRPNNAGTEAIVKITGAVVEGRNQVNSILPPVVVLETYTPGEFAGLLATLRSDPLYSNLFEDAP